MNRLAQFQFKGRLLLVTAALFQTIACTGYIQSPTPVTPPVPSTNIDSACPTMIPDQATNICPRLKNITLSCGGNGKLHASVVGGSGSPIVLGAKLDDGSVLSAVLVVFNCQDGPREAVTFGVNYTGQVSIPTTAPPLHFAVQGPLFAVSVRKPALCGFRGPRKGQTPSNSRQSGDNQLRQQTWHSGARNVSLQLLAPDAVKSRLPTSSIWVEY